MDKFHNIEMDFSEKWGKDVEDAVQLALSDLGASRDEVEVIVLEEPSKGFFGIGSKLAKVRVEKKKKEEPKKEEKKVEKIEEKKSEEKKEERPREERPRQEDRPRRREERRGPSRGAAGGAADREDRDEETFVIERNEKRERRRKDRDRSKEDREPGEGGDSRFTIRERPSDLVEVTEHPAITFLKEVTEKMGLTLSIQAYVNEESIYIDMEGKDSGTIIGKRGQTLDSIQYLTSLVVNKDREKYIRVVVDAENYREKRERTLEQLGNRLADKVKRTGKSVRLEPMNPYERKVIHATLQRNPYVTTRSEGEEPYRRVVIELK